MFYFLKITNPKLLNYDCYDLAILVNANSEFHARMLATQAYGDEGVQAWTLAKNSSCEIIRPEDQPLGIILSSFNAG